MRSLTHDLCNRMQLSHPTSYGILNNRANKQRAQQQTAAILPA
jgi:hypothetical protein